MPLSEEQQRQLGENVARVREAMAEAARRSGREPSAVRLVAVTKYVDADLCRAMFAAGCSDLGESRPQSLWQKSEALADLAVDESTPAAHPIRNARTTSAESATPLRWHLIGHLQTNKIRRTLPLVHLIHGADSVRLLEAIDSECASLGRRARVLIEVNVSGDHSKHGFDRLALPQLGEHFASLANIDIQGLMAMGGLESDESTTRREFASLRTLREGLRNDWPPSIRLDELSMGMSDDFTIAIEEGATIVRVGSALFEGLA